jgi:peptide/nickel transport system permease protein
MTRTLRLQPARQGFRISKGIGSRFGRWAYRYGEVCVALLLLAIIVASVVFANYLTAHEPTAAMNLSNRFIPPFWVDGGSIVHPLGTDNMGRDILSRTLHGGRISLQISLIASTTSTLAGMFLGIVAGYVGGLLDRALLGLTDVWISFPFMVLSLAVIAVVGNSVTVLIVLLSLAGWVHSARVTRAQTLKLRQSRYVGASVGFGATPFHVIWQHIVPGVINVNIVMWTFLVGTLVLIEGSLSFIGLGVSPGTPSWGNMLAEGRDYLRDAWWMSIFPGVALMLTVLAVNFLGDALQKLNNHHN